MTFYLDLKYSHQIEHAIAGAVKSCIDNHGPIDVNLVGSATKRVYGAIRSLARSLRNRVENPGSDTDLEWFGANLLDLRSKYGDEWVAIDSQRVIAHATTMLELETILDERTSPLVVFISAVEPEWLLNRTYPHVF